MFGFNVIELQNMCHKAFYLKNLILWLAGIEKQEKGNQLSLMRHGISFCILLFVFGWFMIGGIFKA